MADLAIIVPTRGRPGNLQKVIGAWNATGGFADADLVAAYDADDRERRAYRNVAASAGHRVESVELPRWRPMVHKLNEVARSLAPRYWALGFAGDDHLPRTERWARRYLDVLHELGTGIVYGDDRYQGEQLPTQWAMTTDIVRTLGRMVPAPVQHMYCDNSMLDLGTRAGCIRYLADVVIEHMHPVAGKSHNDAGYRRVNSRHQFARDRVLYNRWLQDQLARDAAAVAALRKEPAGS